MFAPTRARCGIGDYSRHLIAGLQQQPEVETVQVIPVPMEVVQDSIIEVLRNYAAVERLFEFLGQELSEAGDLVHVQHQYFFFGGVAPHKNHTRALLNAIRKPLVMTVHEIAVPNARISPVQRLLLEWSNRTNFQHPAIGHFIVHTEADREILRSRGVSEARLHLIPVGVPPALPMPESDAAKRQLGLEGTRVITLFGFLSRKKGHRVALECLPHLPDDVRLLFAGEQHPDDTTDYVPKLRTEIETRGLSDRVRITGYLPEEEIPVVMAATDVAIAPFVQSSGSASLAHLFAYERAIVASDIPPHRALLDAAPACLALFPTENPPALANAIRLALTSEAQGRLQRGARAYAAAHSYAQIAARTVAVYQEALGVGR